MQTELKEHTLILHMVQIRLLVYQLYLLESDFFFWCVWWISKVKFTKNTAVSAAQAPYLGCSRNSLKFRIPNLPLGQVQKKEEKSQKLKTVMTAGITDIMCEKNMIYATTKTAAESIYFCTINCASKSEADLQ